MLVKCVRLPILIQISTPSKFVAPLRFFTTPPGEFIAPHAFIITRNLLWVYR